MSGIEGIADSAGLQTSEPEIEAAAEAARGLTTSETEDIFALSVVRRQALDPELVATEKALAIGKNGLLELQEQRVGIDDIGGLQNLKEWLEQRRHAFTREAREFGLPLPKGVLILGIPGTGKA